MSEMPKKEMSKATAEKETFFGSQNVLLWEKQGTVRDLPWTPIKAHTFIATSHMGGRKQIEMCIC